jgi:type III secretion system YscQ/HrcQ family protein
VIAPFPWHTLPRIDRATNGRIRFLRRQLEAAFDRAVIRNALVNLFGSTIEVTAGEPSLAPHPDSTNEMISLRSPDGSAALTIEVEADLAAHSVAHLLGRSAPSANPNRPLEETLRGAFLAIVLDVAYRASKGPVLEYVSSHSFEARDEMGLAVVCSVRLDGKPYEARIWFSCFTHDSTSRCARDRLQALTSLPLEVPLVVASAACSAQDLAALEPGDVWISDDGTWIDPNLVGRGVLAAPNQEWGVAVNVTRERIVIEKSRRVLAGDVESSKMGNDDSSDGLSRTAIEVPIVVRIEMGRVTLSAAEWAELDVGDVIETATKLGGPVVLRVAGQQLAEGELVNLDGRIGVRITAIGRGAPF